MAEQRTRQAPQRPGSDLVKAQITNAAGLITEYAPRFGAVVPGHIRVEAFVELALAYVKRSPDLLANAMANPASLILALRECAALGHMPMKGIYALVPMRDKNSPGGLTIVGMEEWRGVVERMFRAGGVTSVHVETGRDNDRVLSFNRTRHVLPDHEYDEFASPADRGPLKAVYAWARLFNGGTSQVAWLNRHEVARHRAMSRTKDGTFWGAGGDVAGYPAGEGPNTEAMWRKTALHVLEGFVPTSAEYRWQVAKAEAAARDWQGIPDRSVVPPYGGGDVEDAVVVDESDWPATAAIPNGQDQ